MQKALVLGVNGQDGSYLAQSLLDRGYGVIGVGRQSASRYLPPATPAFDYVPLDLTDKNGLLSILDAHRPDLAFHVAAIHGSAGFQYEPLWADLAAVNMVSLHTLLEFARTTCPNMRIVYASSSKIFGSPLKGILNETCPTFATCLYSIGKIASLELIRHYRRHHRVNGSNLFLFNHESIRRPASYFIPIIAKAIVAARQDPNFSVRVKTLDFLTDWGSAQEFMDIAVDIAERTPDTDYVMASGTTWQARAMVAKAFARHGLDSSRHIVELLEPQDSGPDFQASIDLMAQTIGRVPVKTIFDVLDEWTLADDKERGQ